METNLGSSEIDVQAAEDFVQSAINIPSEDFGQRKVKHMSDLTEEGGTSNSHLLASEVIRSSDTSSQIE
ncbi:hypothetical protein A2U01_0059712, partial [Trifolium medium]|nr:hypothetical protein [Trifolium medium]